MIDECAIWLIIFAIWNQRDVIEEVEKKLYGVVKKIGSVSNILISCLNFVSSIYESDFYYSFAVNSTSILKKRIVKIS